MTEAPADTAPRDARHHCLVVAYYFPPMGGSGVQRLTKWCKYLPEHGWDVTVLTVEPGAYFAFDEGLLNEVERTGVRVVRTRSVDPTRVGKGGRQVGLQSEWKRLLLAWVTGFLFLPDNKKGWMKPAMKRFRELTLHRPVDLVLSSAPPYTSFLLGAALAKAAEVPHIMDYRDDWLDNPRHRYPTSWHRSRHRQLEQEVLSSAALVTAINSRMAARIEARAPEIAIRVLPQGFDPEDMPGTPQGEKPHGVVRFLYAGMFYDAQQPDTFLRGVALSLERDPSLRPHVDFRFVGLFPEEKHTLVTDLGLEDVVSMTGYLSHEQTLAELASADVLWMTIGHQPGEDMISTGKLFEYMGTGKPIMALVPHGAAREALSGYGAACVLDPDDADGVASGIRTWYSEAQADRLPSGEGAWVRTFDRRVQTGTLAGWMDTLVLQK